MKRNPHRSVAVPHERYQTWPEQVPGGIWCIRWFSARLPTCSSWHRPPPRCSSTQLSWKYCEHLTIKHLYLGWPQIFIRSKIQWLEQWARGTRIWWKIKFLRLRWWITGAKKKTALFSFLHRGTANMLSWLYQLADHNDKSRKSNTRNRSWSNFPDPKFNQQTII